MANPRRFFAFVLTLALVIVLIVVLAKACGAPGSTDTERQNPVSTMSAETVTEERLNELTLQTLAWNAGFVNFTGGAAAEERIAVPTIYTIVLDAAGGGSENGNPGQAASEKAINLDMAFLIQKEIKNIFPEIKVILTRTSDVTMSTQERADVIREANADLCVSLCCGYFAGSEDKRGITTFYNLEEPTDEARLRVCNMSKVLAQFVQKEAVLTTGAVDNETNAAHYDLLAASDIPSVVIQMAYLTDEDDYARITNDQDKAHLAQGIADGIDHALSQLYPKRAEEVTNTQ